MVGIYGFADLKFKINYNYPYFEKLAKDYRLETDDFDAEISVTDAEIQAENLDGNSSADYLESLAIYRKVAEKIVDYSGFLMHGVVVNAEGKGVAFLARSGTGKSTHAGLWQELLGEKLVIINGDKPLVRLIDGEFYAYGTPYAGKENIHKNDKVKLTDVFFIERNEKNFVTPCEDIFRRLAQQIYIPRNEKMLKTLELIDTFSKKVKFHVIHCNKDIEAAKVAYSKIKD